jgi:hypothetical protein
MRCGVEGHAARMVLVMKRMVAVAVMVVMMEVMV